MKNLNWIPKKFQLTFELKRVLKHTNDVDIAAAYNKVVCS
jgi:hypothetical protein